MNATIAPAARKPRTTTHAPAEQVPQPQIAPLPMHPHRPLAPAPKVADPPLFGVAEPTKQQIRDRAYHIYLARNGGPGDAHADWVQAERELRDEFRRAMISGT